MYAIAFKKADSNEPILYYTGKTGCDWVSKDPSQAFVGYSLEEGVRKASYLLKQRPISLEGFEYSLISPDQIQKGD